MEQNMLGEVIPTSTMQLAESNVYSVLPSESIELDKMFDVNEAVSFATTKPFVTDCKPETAESSMSMLEMSDNHELVWRSEAGLKPLLKRGKNWLVT